VKLQIDNCTWQNKTNSKMWIDSGMWGSETATFCTHSVWCVCAKLARVITWQKNGQKWKLQPLGHLRVWCANNYM